MEPTGLQAPARAGAGGAPKTNIRRPGPPRAARAPRGPYSLEQQAPARQHQRAAKCNWPPIQLHDSGSIGHELANEWEEAEGGAEGDLQVNLVAWRIKWSVSAWPSCVVGAHLAPGSWPRAP